MKLKLVLALMAISLITSCASSKKVDVVQPGDQKLSCDELAKEIGELDAIKTENNDNKGVTGKNVAAALFFWPALAYTYMDANEAEKLISERKSHLANLSNEKGC